MGITVEFIETETKDNLLCLPGDSNWVVCETGSQEMTDIRLRWYQLGTGMIGFFAF